MITFTTICSSNENAQQLIAKWAIAEDQAHAKRLQNETRRHNFLLARSTLRALLNRTTGVSTWQIRPDSNGKPYALSIRGKPTPHISLSHTKGLVACAVCETNPIGIDVEYWRERDFIALAEYAFNFQEREQIARDGKSAFYHIWTLKEAMAKTTGKGVFATIKEENYVIDTQMEGCRETNTWQLYYEIPTPNYSLAIATKGQHTWSSRSLILVNMLSQQG